MGEKNLADTLIQSVPNSRLLLKNNQFSDKGTQNYYSELFQAHGITRDRQDTYALRSQQRTARAQAEGWLAEEITAVQISNGGKSLTVNEDEHPRPKITLAQLAKLKPREWKSL